jgi:RHS repeat-associated protein
VNSASVNIPSPDSVAYTVSNVFDLDQGQSLLITNEKTVSEMKGNANIPDKLVFSYGGNNLAFEYTSLNGEGQIRKGSSGSYYYNYYLKDHLGSTRMIINDAGDITDAIMYQPYGTMEEVAGIATPGADPERERFTGKEFDREGKINGANGIELFYFGARYFDPDIGIWIGTDPVDQFLNTYSYCGANPILIIDPDGTKAVDNPSAAYRADLITIYELSPETYNALLSASEVISPEILSMNVDVLSNYFAPTNTGFFSRFIDVLSIPKDMAGASVDFIQNYFDMRKANTIGADKYFHSKANYQGASRGIGGNFAATKISNAREWNDMNRKGDPLSASEADQVANLVGRAGAKINRPMYKIFRPRGLPNKY